MTHQPPMDGFTIERELDAMRVAMDAALASLDGESFRNLQRHRSSLLRQIPGRISDPSLKALLFAKVAAEDEVWVSLAREAGAEIKREIEGLKTDKRNRENLSRAYGHSSPGSRILSHAG